MVGRLAYPGLSPRVRGNLTKPGVSEATQWSIPACAGEPLHASGHRTRRPVYPRVCGGTRCTGLPISGRRGLSPRVRGNHCPPRRNRCAPRSIPACAGEPCQRWAGRGRTSVYPRVCGGTACTHNLSSSMVGLSPRVRGNHVEPDVALVSPRSIPACAGEPPVVVDNALACAVYPRVCGGTPPWGSPCSCCNGLSPRVRGNHIHWTLTGQTHRSIPACAGEPTRRTPTPSSRGVYPRVCGGTPSRSGWQRYERGLSPRVRGNHVDNAPRVVVAGSIPACAGEPTLRAATASWRRVYPRVCGGTRPLPPPTCCRLGLSPRVRGNRLGLGRRQAQRGSIPACAGEPR